MGARGRHVTGARGPERAATRGAMAGGGDDGSWVELHGAGGPGPWRFSSRPAEVEQMLLEAQLDVEPHSTWPVTSPPARDDTGAAPLGQRLRPCGQHQPIQRRHRPPLQRELPPSHQDLPPAQRVLPEHRGCLPPSLARAGARLPPALLPCSPPAPLWSLPSNAVAGKKRLFSSELLLLFVPSLLLSHLLTLGLGIYIGKRLAASSANPL